MTEHSPDFTVDTVILAGGSARRMGGMDKPALTVGRISLVQRAIDAAARSRHIVVVGPHRPELSSDIVQTREAPAGAGPVAAIAAGLAAMPDSDAAVVLVLAADLPFVDGNAVESLLMQLKSHSAVFAQDDTGRTQYLFGAWRADDLSRRLDDVPDTSDLAMRSILPDDHAVTTIESVGDCDTVADLELARELLAARSPDEPVPTAEQARELIRERIRPLSPRAVAPGAALGSTLSEPLVAVEPLPPVDISAMDGYAVCGEAPWTIRAEVAYAGTYGHDGLAPGDALRIATGAQVPAGATSVIRDEHVSRDGRRLIRRGGSPVRDDTRRAGEDWAAGIELVAPGTQVSPAVVSVALSAEVETLTVRGPVLARIALSGNEIRSDGALKPGQTRDSIGSVLPTYLAFCGIDVLDTVHLQDSPTAFENLLQQPSAAHVVIVVGATGGGAADQLRRSLARADADIVVHRTRVRPGGSQITAVLPNGIVVLGLPGNPLAAISTVMLTAPAVVDALTARTTPPPVLGYLADDSAAAPTGRIVPVRRDGALWRAQRDLHTAHLLDLVFHDALALISADHTPGAPVELLLLPR